RRERLRQPLPSEEEKQEIQVAEFSVGRDRHAIRLDQLRGALPLSLVTPVPLAPTEVVGIVSFRGELLTVYSFAALLGIRGWRTDPSVLLIIETDSGGRLAVDCEEAPRPNAIAQSRIRRQRDLESQPIADVLAIDGRPIRFITDIAAVISRGSI